MKNLSPSFFRRFVCLFACLCFCKAASVEAIDLSKLESIGAISSFTKTDRDITFNCRDGSQVRLSVLAPDLVRIRAAFKKALPASDHSWAIAKTAWDTSRWTLKEQPENFIVATDELEVIVRRAPLLIEFRDARTHQTINADERPMMFDPKGETIAATKRLGLDEHFYGLGEKAAPLDKRREAFTNWNSDTPAYKEGTDPIYQTVPFYIGLQNGVAYGIFFDNSYRSYFDFGKSSQQYAAFSADGGEMNYYFFAGASIKKILGRYADLTGHMPLPPVWALGHQQSRWSYYPDTMVEEIVRRYRAEDLPLDVMHLDIDYMNGYRVFTWDKQRFPNPSALIEKLNRQGVKVVTIIDPGVKYQPEGATALNQTNSPGTSEPASQDKSYYVYNEGAAKNYFLKRKSGELYVGKVWPGESVYVDFTLEAARHWWGDLHQALTNHGVAGIWNDMNEPSDFVDQTGKSQMDVVSDDEGARTTHAKNRNVYALLEARATYEGLERLQPDKRPYIITRAGYAGIQRYSTMWTGDATSTWDSLALVVPMFETLGLSGEPFIGSDVGGFIGRGNGELLTRAYQISFLAPFCRNHKDISGYDQEPWRFGKYYEDIIRKYLKLRYRLMPFLYTTLEEAHRTGVPLFRPLLLNYQTDENTLNLDDEFMIGSDLLIAPIVKPDVTSRMVYLPQGTWFDYWTGKKHSGKEMIRVDAPLETVPMFVRGGGIIPLWPEMNYVGEKPASPLTFEIYPDENGRAATTLYEDDGTSPAYKRGAFRRTAVSMTTSRNGALINLDAPEGTYQPGARNFIFTLKPSTYVRQVLLDDKPLGAVKINDNRNGWYMSSDKLVVKLVDNGGARRIQIK